MKKGILFFLLFTVFTAAQSFASDFNDGVLNYTIIKDAGGVATTNVQVDKLVNTSTASVTIPATVTNPSDSKTYNVTSIGISAFYNCSELTSVTIPSSVTSIGESAFKSSGLTSVTIPTSVTSIGENAFIGCLWLTSIDLSNANSLQTIGASAFRNCSNATFITTTGTPATPVKYNALTSIGNYAFRECSGLKDFDISGATNLTSIEDRAFLRAGLTSIIIPASVTSIGVSAFYYCAGLKSIDLSAANGLQTIGASAFAGCSAATFKTTKGSPATAVKYNALTSIGNQAFYNCTGLTTFDISGATNITSIENYSFYGCSGLTSVTIPVSVTSIGYEAFYNCTGLTSIDLSAATGLQTIGEQSFYNCSNAIFITAKGSPATAIKYDALTSIGNEAFYGCSGLNDFDMSGATNLTSIGRYAFYNSGLTSVIIPTSVTSIGTYAFNGCSKLTAIDLSNANSLQTIGASAFYNCSNATFKTTTGSPATAVKYNALTSIENYAFYNCTGLTTFDISGATNLTSIGGSAFYGCTGLVSITIPSSVTTIKMEAFRGCTGLTTVTIPASVTSIEECAFNNCTKLSTVYLEPTTPPSLGTNIFYNCKSDIKFYINDGTTDKAHISTYKTSQSAITDANAIPYLPKKVTEAKVATLYLPYEVDIPEGITAYYCSGKATGYISMTKLEGGVIPANTPVYLTATDAATFNFIANGKSTPAVSNDDILKGLTADLTVTTSNTYLTLGKASDDTYGFYKYKGTTIAANTCYIEYSGSAAKGFNISFDGSTTGINEAAAPATAGKRMIYDLQGRRVTNPVKGIYIINGKKVIF